MLMGKIKWLSPLAGPLCLVAFASLCALSIVQPSQVGGQPRELRTVSYIPGETVADSLSDKASFYSAVLVAFFGNYVCFTSSSCMKQARTNWWYCILLIQLGLVRGVLVTWGMHWTGMQDRSLAGGSISGETSPLPITTIPSLVVLSALQSWIQCIITSHLSWTRNPPAEGWPPLTRKAVTTWLVCTSLRAASNLAVIYMGLGAQVGNFRIKFLPGHVVGTVILGILTALGEMGGFLFLPNKNLLRIVASLVNTGLIDGLHFAGMASCRYVYNPVAITGSENLPSLDSTLWLLVANLLCLFNCMYFMKEIIMRDREALQAGLEYESFVKNSVKLLNRVSQMRFPMALIRMDILLSQGKLLPHEKLRDQQKLLFADSPSLVARLRKEGLVVFMSHQWLSTSLPDPRNRLFADVKHALEQLAMMRGVAPDKVFVWMAYMSMPQQSSDQQQLVIDSIPAYAAAASAFVIVAPQTLHLDHQIPSGFMTYANHFWCRLELFCSILSMLRLKISKDKEDEDHLWAVKVPGSMSRFNSDLSAQSANLNAKQRIFLVLDGQVHRLNLFTPANAFRPQFEKLLYIYEGEMDCCQRGHLLPNGDEVPCDKVRAVETLTGGFGMMLADLHYIRSQRTVSPEDAAVRDLVDSIVKQADRLLPQEFFGSRIEAMNEFLSQGFKSTTEDTDGETGEAGSATMLRAESFLTAVRSLHSDRSMEVNPDPKHEEREPLAMHLEEEDEYPEIFIHETVPEEKSLAEVFASRLPVGNYEAA